MCFLFNKDGFKMMEENIPYMLATIVAMAFAVAIGSLLGVHTYLLMKAMSTIEMAALIKNNPFSKGNWKDNLALVMGYHWQKYLIPVDVKDR
jgi:hypothetical protein